MREMLIIKNTVDITSTRQIKKIRSKSNLLVLIKRQGGSLGSAGSKRGGSDQTRKHGVLYNALIVKKPEVRYFRFSRNLHSVELVGKRIYNYEDVAEFGRYDVATIVPPMFRPHNVNLVVSKVSRL